jgi:hypothetical protein
MKSMEFGTGLASKLIQHARSIPLAPFVDLSGPRSWLEKPLNREAWISDTPTTILLLLRSIQTDILDIYMYIYARAAMRLPRYFDRVNTRYSWLIGHCLNIASLYGKVRLCVSVTMSAVSRSLTLGDIKTFKRSNPGPTRSDTAYTDAHAKHPHQPPQFGFRALWRPLQDSSSGSFLCQRMQSRSEC